MATNIFDMTDTWNNGGTVFTSIKMALTQTASAAGSKIMNLLRNGVSQFAVDPVNGVTVGVPTGDAMGPGRVNVSGGYYVNGVPLIGQVTGSGNNPVFNDDVLGLIVRPIVSTDLPAALFAGLGAVKAKAPAAGQALLSLDEGGNFQQGFAGRELLTTGRTYFVRTEPVAVSISIASPGVVTWNAHGLAPNTEVYFSRLPRRSTVTITIASPGVVTWNSHGFAAGDPVRFAATTGAFPTGIVAGQTYYVIAAGLTANTFQFALDAGGAAINTSGSQSGTHTAARVENRNGTMPTGINEGTAYFVVGASITTNTFTVSATPNGAAINTSGSTTGQLYGTFGTDSNDGLTALTPFGSIQKAIDSMAALDMGIFGGTIRVGGSVYTNANIPMILKSITGDNANILSVSDATIVATGNFGCISASGIRGNWTVDGFTVEMANGSQGSAINVIRGSLVSFNNICFAQVDAAGLTGAHFQATNGANVTFNTGYNILGGAAVHFNISLNASVTCAGKHIALVNTPKFVNAFVQCIQSAVIGCNANTYNGAAAAGTKKFVAATNGTIDTQSANLAYFPGDAGSGTVDGAVPGAAPAQGAAGGVYA